MSALAIAGIQLRLASDWLEKHAVYLDAYKLMEGCGMIGWEAGRFVMFKDHPLFVGAGDEN